MRQGQMNPYSLAIKYILAINTVNILTEQLIYEWYKRVAKLLDVVDFSP